MKPNREEKAGELSNLSKQVCHSRFVKFTSLWPTKFALAINRLINLLTQYSLNLGVASSRAAIWTTNRDYLDHTI